MLWPYTKDKLLPMAERTLRTMADHRAVLVVDAGVRLRAKGGISGVQVLFHPLWVHAGTGLLLGNPPEDIEDAALAATAFWALGEGWLDEHAGACPANRAILIPTALGAASATFDDETGRYFAQLTKRCGAVTLEHRKSLEALQANAQAALGSWGILSHEEEGAWHPRRFPASVPMIYPLGTTQRERTTWRREVVAERKRVLRRVAEGLDAAYREIGALPLADA